MVCGATTIDLTLASQRLALSYQQTLTLALRGTIRAERVNGRWRVMAEDVERLRESSAVGSGAAGATEG